MLNACYSEPQAAAIAEEIDCVVGMASDIEDAAAISFSAAFYQALGYGKDVATAFAAGCVQIGLEQDAPSGTIEAHATAGAMVGAAGTPKLLARRVRASEIVFVPDQAPREVEETPSARPSGGGVQIGSVGGSISHSVIAGGDAGHITIAGSGQGESGTARPTLEGLARRLDAISRALAAVNAQGEMLGAVSPAAPFAAQGAAQSIADAAQRLSSPAAGSGTEVGPIMRRRIAEAGVLLRGIQDSAGTAEESVTESAGGYVGMGKLAGELSALCTQVEEAAAWADTLWPAE